MEEQELAEHWLATLQLAQIGVNRLLRNLDVVEQDLTFWRSRLSAGQHGLFLLLGQGPSTFVRTVKAAVQRRSPEQVEARRRAKRLSSAGKIERRLVALRTVQRNLAEAAAKLNSRSGTLYLNLQQPRKRLAGEASNGGGNGRSQGDPRDTLFSACKHAIAVTTHATVEVFEKLRQLQAKMEEQKELPRNASRMDLTASSAVEQTLASVPQMPQLPACEPATGVPSASAGDDNPPLEQQDAQGQLGADAAEEPAALACPDRAEVTSTQSLSSSELAAALQRAEQAVGVELHREEGLSAGNAIQHANRASHRAELVVSVPAWARAPSKYQQHWIRFSGITIASLWAAFWLYKHSRLSGSRDIERWLQQAITGLQSTYRENVLGPLRQLQAELFKTFRQRRSIVSVEEYETDKETLCRMLADFQADYLKKHHGKSPKGREQATTESSDDMSDAKIMPGMEFMMEAYETELKRPIRNLVTGQLPRSLLIQVQKLKVDTEAAMLEIDQILKANELNMALVAAVPAFLVTGGVIVLVYRYFQPTPPDPKREALPCRMAMVELERAIQKLDGGSEEDHGIMLYELWRVYREAMRLYERHDASSAASEWPNLRTDLIELAAPLSLKHKLRISKRITRVYTIFQF